MARFTRRERCADLAQTSVPGLLFRSRTTAVDAELHSRGDQIGHPKPGRLTLLPRLAIIFLLAVSSGPWFASELPQPDATTYEEGATGYVLTVLKGRTVERIPLHYIGTYNDFLGPGYDLHLVQLEGPVAEHVGIAAGMSGSPVYLGDRLIGALSYRMGEPGTSGCLVADICALIAKRVR